ncbi:MAG: sodium:alanine symporter family protein [Oscillospiraceae bacterium]|nr:sodium:alanine symporter family protein [Oscillospiraceae bacterium]
MNLSSIISALDDFAWGPVMLVLLVGTGFYLSFRTGFLQFTHILYWLKNTAGKLLSKHEAGEGEVTPLQALTTALAATVGTGNIAGVTGAIFIGGPGAVFWMWVAALVGMVTKYSEVVLAVRYRERNDKGDWVGGPMYYIKNGMGQNWAWLGGVFCVLASLAAFGIGNATQVQSIADAVNNAIDSFDPSPASTFLFFGSDVRVSTFIVGVVVAVIVALVLFGGIKRIGQVTEKLVPFMAVLYIVAALFVILANVSQLGKVFAMIFKGAFNADAALGGAVGITVMTSMRKGVGRGCFSNEAGLGSAPIAHAATSETDPVRQGLYGIFEVFMDTIVICTLTSLTVLCAYAAGGINIPWGTGGNGSSVAAAMSTVFGSRLSAIVIAISLSLFALSTILSWSLYGTRCCEYLFGVKATRIYQGLFIVFVIIGATMSLADAWNLADALNGFMAFPNLIALLALSGVVARLTREHLAANCKKK